MIWVQGPISAPTDLAEKDSKWLITAQIQFAAWVCSAPYNKQVHTHLHMSLFF